TSFAEHQRYPRGKRLVLYDAEGDFDRNFDWWKESGKHRVVEPQLPFENGRSDLLTGSGSRLDIENINLLATLLVHAQYQGYWNQLGMQFQEEMEALLERHVLSGLSMPRGSGRMIRRATTTGSLPLSKSLLRTLLKRVSV